MEYIDEWSRQSANLEIGEEHKLLNAKLLTELKFNAFNANTFYTLTSRIRT